MNDTTKTTEEVIETTPDDEGLFVVESHVKIFDPETKEVFVNQR
jgi:hypothetical protein